MLDGRHSQVCDERVALWVCGEAGASEITSVVVLCNTTLVFPPAQHKLSGFQAAIVLNSVQQGKLILNCARNSHSLYVGGKQFASLNCHFGRTRLQLGCRSCQERSGALNTVITTRTFRQTAFSVSCLLLAPHHPPTCANTHHLCVFHLQQPSNATNKQQPCPCVGEASSV